ncbi:hypothetical protein BSKO_00944 [Bryopsis sp. KO-2023]|nr:hypothetical protein BSKO_00944 [Bryopsis sp. KO-2023]
MSWGRQNANRDQSLNLTYQTKSFLDGLVQRRGLSKRAVDDVKRSIQNGTSGWVDVMLTKECKPRTERRPRAHAGPRIRITGTPQRWAGKKMLDEILRDSPPERDQFHGGSICVDREAEKDKLIRKFAYGEQGASEIEAGQPDNRKSFHADARPATEQMIDQIIDEIQDRRTFLERMRKCGREREYESQIKLEIASRLAELRGLGVKIN